MSSETDSATDSKPDVAEEPPTPEVGQDSKPSPAKSAARSGHAVEPPPSIRPKAKPRPAEPSVVPVKRVGHSEGESGPSHPKTGPNAVAAKRSYRTTHSVPVTVDEPLTARPTTGPQPQVAGPVMRGSDRPAAKPGKDKAAAAAASAASPAAASAQVNDPAVAFSAKAAASPTAADSHPVQSQPSRPVKRVAGSRKPTVATTTVGGPPPIAVAPPPTQTVPAPARRPAVSPGVRPAAGAGPGPDNSGGLTQVVASAAGIEATGVAAQGPARAGKPVKLNLSYVAPMSVMKVSFLVSVAMGIAFVVAVYILWSVLNDRAVFTQMDQMIGDMVGDNRPESLDVLQYVGAGRIMSGAAIIAIIDVVVFTIISTLAAVIYNLLASLVGGVRVTLKEE